MKRFSSKKTIVVRRSQSLGDVLAATCVGNALLDQGHSVLFQSHENSHPILRRHSRIKTFGSINGTPNVNLDGVYERDPDRRFKPMAKMYIDSANKQLEKLGIVLPFQNWAPRIMSDAFKNESIRYLLEAQLLPWIMVVPRSNSFVNKTVPDKIWEEVAQRIDGTCFWLGSHGPAPKGFVDLKCRTVEDLIEYIACADMVVTAETGPMHIAAALGVQVLAIQQAVDPAWALSDQRDFMVVSPKLDCLNCQQGECPVDEKNPPCQDIEPIKISAQVNWRAKCQYEDFVSAVIAVYKPDLNRLEKCIRHLLEQVQEVVIAYDLDSGDLSSFTSNARIKMVKMNAHVTGYGRKANFGARHTNGRYLLFINDDVFLNADVVERLKEEMKSGVAAVTHTLRYPNKSIQYAGKHRPAGAHGFGHTDYKRSRSRHAAPVEQESFCGASVLIRRDAFYEVDGFDERFRLFSEDDDLAMKLRQAGWKLIFTPLAEAIHIEHSSMSVTPDWHDPLKESAAKFAAKWGFYFKANPNPNRLGTF